MLALEPLMAGVRRMRNFLDKIEVMLQLLLTGID